MMMIFMIPRDTPMTHIQALFFFYDFLFFI